MLEKIAKELSNMFTAWIFLEILKQNVKKRIYEISLVPTVLSCPYICLSYSFWTKMVTYLHKSMFMCFNTVLSWAKIININLKIQKYKTILKISKIPILLKGDYKMQVILIILKSKFLNTIKYYINSFNWFINLTGWINF